MPTTTVAPPACSSCAIAVVELQLGNDLTLRSCSHCDRRQWLRDGRPAGLDLVLSVVGAASGKRRLVTTA